MPIYTATIIFWLAQLGRNWRLLNRKEIQCKRSSMLQNLRMFRCYQSIGTHLGFRSPGRKEWISIRYDLGADWKQKGVGRQNRNNTPELLDATDKKIGKSARTHKRKWMSDIARDAEKVTNNCRETYSLIKKPVFGFSSSIDKRRVRIYKNWEYIFFLFFIIFSLRNWKRK